MTERRKDGHTKDCAKVKGWPYSGNYTCDCGRAEYLTKIEYSEWREDVYDTEGTLIQKQVLFIRATKRMGSGAMEFHMPVWDETEEEITTCKELLTRAIEREIKYNDTK